MEDSKVREVLKILKNFPDITKVVITKKEDKEILVLFTKYEANHFFLTCKIDDQLKKHNIKDLDVYPISDEHFYNNNYSILKVGKVYYNNGKEF